MNIPVYTYIVGGHDVETGVYTFHSEEERETAIRNRAREIAEQVELEDLDEIAPEDIEDELTNVDIYFHRGEPVMDLPVLGELVEALTVCETQLRDYVEWHHKFENGCSVEMETAWTAARDALNKAKGIK